jgi:hypothetical protein
MNKSLDYSLKLEQIELNVHDVIVYIFHQHQLSKIERKNDVCLKIEIPYTRTLVDLF